MGAHTVRDGHATYYVDFYDASERAPDEIIAVADGVPVTMNLAWGAPHQGVYRGERVLDEDCVEYFFEATIGGERVRFPDYGSYGIGEGCDWDDPGAAWVDRQLGVAGRDDLSRRDIRQRLELVGCSSVGVAGGT